MAIEPIKVGLRIEQREIDSITSQIESISPTITIGKIEGGKAIDNIIEKIEKAFSSIDSSTLTKALSGIGKVSAKSGIKNIEKDLDVASSKAKKFTVEQQSLFKSLDSSIKAVDSLFRKANKKMPGSDALKELRKEYEEVSKLPLNMKIKGADIGVDEIRSAIGIFDTFAVKLSGTLDAFDAHESSMKNASKGVVASIKEEIASISEEEAKLKAAISLMNVAKKEALSAFGKASSKTKDEEKLKTLNNDIKELLVSAETINNLGKDANVSDIERVTSSLNEYAKVANESAAASKSSSAASKAMSSKQVAAMKEVNAMTTALTNSYKKYLEHAVTPDETISSEYKKLIEDAQLLKSKKGDLSISESDALIKRMSEQIAKNKELTASIKERASAEKQAAKETLSKEEKAARSLKKIAEFESKVQKYYSGNTKLKGTTIGSELENMLSEIRNINPAEASKKLTMLETRFSQLQTAASAKGLTGKSWLDKLNSTFTTFAGWTIMSASVIHATRAIKDMFDNVKNLDAAMTELKKVTNESNTTYEKFFNEASTRAKKTGATMVDTIQATADASRLGLNLDQATAMADAALVYKNVGDGIENISDASNSIISTVQAFSDLGYSAEHSMDIVDKFNEVGNNFAITSSGIGEALQRSASALASGNNTLDESIGLITAANTIVQNPDSVGTMLKTVSMYLRAAKADAEAAGESTDGMANSMSSLRDTVKTLTHGQVDIQLDENTFKSTYQILKEISDVWDTMTDIDQAALLEKLGGKRNANAVSAMITNFDIAERAMKKSQDSAGSALIENEKYLDSIGGRLAEFSATWESFSSAVIDSGFVKGMVDFGTSIIETFDFLTKKLGGIPTIISSIVAAMTIRNGVMGKDAGLFSIFGYNTKTGKIGLNGNSPFMPFIRAMTTSRKEFNSTKEAFISGSKDVGISFSNMLTSVWEGVDSESITSKSIESFNKLSKSIDDLDYYSKLSKLDGLNKGVYKDTYEEAKRANVELDNFIDKEHTISKARAEYFRHVKSTGEKASYEGFMSFAREKGFDIQQGGLKQAISNTVGNIGNMIAGTIASIGISLAVNYIINGIQDIYKSVAVTKEEMIQATQNANEYQKTISSIGDTKSAVNNAWSIIESSSSGTEERIAAYEQLRGIQSDIIKQYGDEVSGLMFLSSSSKEAAESMAELEAAEARRFKMSNKEEIDKARKMMEQEIGDGYGITNSLGRISSQSDNYKEVKDAIQNIVDKYDDVVYVEVDGEAFITIKDNAVDAQETISNLTKDFNDMVNVFADKGIDVSQIFSGLSDVPSVFANMQGKIDEIKEEYGEVYDAAIQAYIADSDKYSEAVMKLSEKQDNIQKAMSQSINPEQRINALRDAIKDIDSLTAESLLGKEFGKNSSVDRYIQNWIDQLQESVKASKLEVELDDWLKIGNKPSDTMAIVKKQLDGELDGKSLGVLKEMNELSRSNALDNEKAKASFAELKAVADDYGVSVNQLLDKLYDYGAITGSILDKEYDYASILNDVKDKFSSGNIFAGLGAAIESQNKNGGFLSSDAYEALISSSSEYAKAVEYENGYIRLNIDYAKKLSDEKAKLAKQSIEEQKQLDMQRYAMNAKEIQKLLNDGADITNSRVQDLQRENSQIEANIQKYNAYASTLKQISSGYYAFSNVSSSDNTDIEFGVAGDAKKVIEESLESGKTGVGNVQYQMALDFIIPDDVQQKGEKAVSDYMSTINRYMADEKQGMSNFLADMVTAGVASNEDGKIKLNADMTMDKFLDAFANAGGKIKPITEDVVEAMFGAINMYTDDPFKLIDPSDVSNIMNLVNSWQKAQAELPTISGDDNISKKKQEIAEYAEKLSEIPPETLSVLGIEIKDGNGNVLTGDEIKNIVEEISEDASNASVEAPTIEVAINGIDDAISQLDEVQSRIKSLEAEKVGLEDIVRYKDDIGLNSSEAKARIEEINSELENLRDKEITINAYVNMQGMQDAHSKITELRKQAAALREEIEHRGRVGLDTSEAQTKLEQVENELSTIESTELGMRVTASGFDELYSQAEVIQQKIQEITGGDANVQLTVDQQGDVDELYAQLEEIQTRIQEAGGELEIDLTWKSDGENSLEQIIAQTAEGVDVKLNVDASQITEAVETAVSSAGEAKVTLIADTTKLQEGLTEISIPVKADTTTMAAALSGLINTVPPIKVPVDLSMTDMQIKMAALKASLSTPINISSSITVDESAFSTLQKINDFKISTKSFSISSNAGSVLASLSALDRKTIKNKSFTVTEYRKVVGGGDGVAKGTTNASGGRTLIGELGPEMVVSNGKYYVAGQFGAEFVDLNKGDIVFNHKDTERILNGEPGARGRALSSGSISLDKLTGTSSSSSSSKSGSSSSNTAKALTSKASKSSESMDKKLEKLIKELSETLDNFDSAIKASLAEGGDIDAIIQTYRDALAAIEAQKEAYRKKGVKEDSKYMNDLKAQWYEYRDKMASSIKEYYDKLIDSQENFSKLREKSIENMLHSNDQSKIYEYMNDRLEAITKQQDLLHEQAERLREAGFLDTDKEVAELSLKWWDLQEDKIKAQVDIYDALIDRLEATNTLFERMRDNTTKDANRDNTLDNDRNSAIIATNELLKNLKFQREAIEEKLAAYSAMGYSQSSKEVLELKEEWYKVSDAVEDAREQIVDTLNEMASNTSELIEEVKNVFDVFHKAAEDYADNNGFISVDSYRDILELGPQYMQMLKDENGVLVINKEKIDGVIKALTEKAAVESALSYLEQVKIAYMFGETEMLDKLIYSTATTTEGTWGLVYANAALLKVLGLSDEQYEQLMWNLKAYQSIANNVKDGVSVVGSKDLDELKNGAEDLLDYVMDMIKHEIEEQVKALQKMKDDYADIIKLKKESLEITKKESDYQEEIADKLKEASKIQAQINALSLDDSREAIARRKELEESLAELQKDIAKDQADYALDRQKDMLDDSQDAYEKQKDEEIETLENTISSKEKLYRLAIERIETHWETIYSELIEWNTEYGNSLNKEITSTWELAKEAVNMYGYNFEEVISKMEARIKELKGELSDLGDTATNLIVGDLDGSNTSFLNEEAIKAIVSMMEQNSATWITDADGSHVSNQKLADELRKYGLDPYFNSRTGEWYTDSSMSKRLYDSYGDGFNSFNVGSVESNAAVIKMLVNKMKSNSAAWAGSSNEQRTKLSKQNIDIAKTLRSYGIDVGTSTDKSGAWIIKSDRLNPGNVGRRLYDVYHKGGIVGDAGTIKQNEMIAKLEKGEAVLDKKKESGVMRLLDFASSVADRVGSMMNNSSIGHMDLAVAGAFGSLQPVQAYTVNFGDTYITGTSDENISAHKKITRDFTNEVLKQLNIKR